VFGGKHGFTNRWSQIQDSYKVISSIVFVLLSAALDTYLEFLDTSSATEKVASSVFCHAGVSVFAEVWYELCE